MWNFKVEKRDLSIPIGEQNGELYSRVPRKSALVRTDNEEVLAIASDRYEVTQHNEVFQLFDRIPSLQYENYKLSEDGGVCFWNFKIKDANVSSFDVKVGDTVDFSFRAFNSHNFLTGRGGELIAKRLVCLNGMTMPKTVQTISFRHVNNQAMDRIDSSILDYTDQMENMVNMWRQWLTHKTEEAKIDSFINKLNLQDVNFEEEITDKMKSSSNLWDIYNHLTHYITHQMVSRGKNKIANQRKKSLEYTNMFYNHKW